MVILDHAFSKLLMSPGESDKHETGTEKCYFSFKAGVEIEFVRLQVRKKAPLLVIPLTVRLLGLNKWSQSGPDLPRPTVAGHDGEAL